MNNYLTNTHKFEKKMGHVKKTTLSTHQEQLQKQEAQANKDDMTPNRYLQLKVDLFLIQSCQDFSVEEKTSFRVLIHKDWIPCAVEIISFSYQFSFVDQYLYT
jgi:hypothetical protein